MAQCGVTRSEAKAAIVLAREIKRRIADNGGTLIIANDAILSHAGYETLAKAIPHDRGRATTIIDSSSAGFALDELVCAPGHRLVHYDEPSGGGEQCLWAMVPSPVELTAPETSDQPVHALVG